MDDLTPPYCGSQAEGNNAVTEQHETKYQRELRARREKKKAALGKLQHLPRGEEIWYVGRNEEWYDGGMYATREAAISVGQSDYDGDGFHIICARIDPVDIAAHFNFDEFAESIDENGDYLSGESFDSVFDAFNMDQLDDLENRVRNVMREWQIECHALGQVVRGDLFTCSHSGEYIPPIQDNT